MKFEAGTITATLAANADTFSPDSSGPDTQGVVGVSGTTFTSLTVVVEGKLAGGTIWYPIKLTDRKTLAQSSGSVAVANGTTTSWFFDARGFQTLRIYASAGSSLDVVTEWLTGTTDDFGGSIPTLLNNYSSVNTFAGGLVVADSQLLGIGTDSDMTISSSSAGVIDLLFAADNSTVNVGASGNSADLKVFGAGASTFFTWDTSADSLKFEDNVFVGFGSNTAGVGTKGDINVAFDGTDLLVAQTTADTTVKWGVSGAGINHLFYGDTATRDMTWDQSNDQLLFADNAKLAIGSGAGAAGDITFSWNASKMLVAQLTANSAIDWGVDGAGIDMVFYGDTASANVTWDQSADALIFNGAVDLQFTGTTGQPEIVLTDNLADALSVKISGGADLMVLTTTDNAESVAIRGVRHTSTTAVAITGATALTLADSGGVFTVSQAAAYDIDLPSPTTGPGCRYFFHLTAAGANNVTVTVLGGAATFVGTITIDGATVPATGSTLTFASGASVLGDSIEIQSLATNLYHVRAIASGAGGIAIS